MNKQPTPYQEVNSIVSLLLENSQEVLDDNLLALYLHGSLATGDFNEKSSDIDFIAILNKELSDEMIKKLEVAHQEILQSDSKWAKKFEGSFVQKDLLKSIVPPEKPRPYINGDGFHIWPYGYEWVIEKYVIREKSLVVFGPPPSNFLEKVSADDMRSANSKILIGDWKPMIKESSRLEDDEYQAYAVLTMCRCLFLFENGEMTSKPVAVKWTKSRFPQWRELVEVASKWRKDETMNRLKETINFIKFTIEFTESDREKDNIT